MHPYMMDKVTQEQHADTLRWVENYRGHRPAPRVMASPAKPLRVWLGQRLIELGNTLAHPGRSSTSLTR